MSTQKLFNLKYAAFASIVASSGFSYVYNTSVFNSVLNYLKNYLFPDISPSIVTFIASSPIITSALGALLGGSLAGKFGRRQTMMVLDIIMIIGVLMTLVTVIPVIIIGRLTEGFVFGCNSVIAPLYFIEMSPVPYRGPLSNGPGIFASLGSLIAYGFGFLIPKTLAPGESSEAWRLVLAFPILIAVIRLASFLIVFRYETPFYLVSKNQIKEAQKSLEQVYLQNVEDRLNEIIRERDYISNTGSISIWELFTKKYRKAFFVGVFMMSMQSISGLTVILVYSSSIFENGITDVNDNLPLILSNCLAAINLAGAVFSIWTMSKFGRKSLLVFGSFFTGLFEILFAVIAMIASPASIISKIFLVTWPIPFGLSLGSVIYAMVPESLPDIGVSVASLSNLLFSFVMVQYFPSVVSVIGVNYTFIIMGGITVAASALFMVFTVETRNKSKSEILKNYSDASEIDTTSSLLL